MDQLLGGLVHDFGLARPVWLLCSAGLVFVSGGFGVCVRRVCFCFRRVWYLCSAGVVFLFGGVGVCVRWALIVTE